MKAFFVHDDVEQTISPETNVTNIETCLNDLEFVIRRNVAKFWLSHPYPYPRAKSFFVSLGFELHFENILKRLIF